jgi:hypothetical protein
MPFLLRFCLLLPASGFPFSGFSCCFCRLNIVLTSFAQATARSRR